MLGSWSEVVTESRRVSRYLDTNRNRRKETEHVDELETPPRTTILETLARPKETDDHGDVVAVADVVAPARRTITVTVTM